MNSFFSISSPVLNPMAHYPMGTTSANHADLLYFLALSVSTGQHPFIHQRNQQSMLQYSRNGWQTDFGSQKNRHFEFSPPAPIIVW
jgi:hypothetical protein